MPAEEFDGLLASVDVAENESALARLVESDRRFSRR
jgi:hypothetical protein